MTEESRIMHGTVIMCTWNGLRKYVWEEVLHKWRETEQFNQTNLGLAVEYVCCLSLVCVYLSEL